jgi:hypothetical protein
MLMVDMQLFPALPGYVGYRALPSWDINKLRSQLDVYVGQSEIESIQCSSKVGMTSGAQICLVSPVNRISRSIGLIVLAERLLG